MINFVRWLFRGAGSTDSSLPGFILLQEKLKENWSKVSNKPKSKKKKSFLIKVKETIKSIIG